VEVLKSKILTQAEEIFSIQKTFEELKHQQQQQ